MLAYYDLVSSTSYLARRGKQVFIQRKEEENVFLIRMVLTPKDVKI